MNKNSLKFEVVWKDAHMFEMRISVNNGRYSGITEVYEQSKPLLAFVTELNGFPFGKDKVTYSRGEKDGYAYFKMEFYKIGSAGKCGVLVTMEENVATEYRKEEKDKLSLELLIDPSAIDVFGRELQSLAEKEGGIAELKAVENYNSNI